ncbi:MgtC/SapB family protein [Salinicola rhizosphaerae]|uniref:Protein MgtC n=1 Tax=Salinicola rhizosphaerae TaxID=1443141 RepID=A0ABQ3E8Z2_9GAMM|nr:MgtC/SapB family protein [Salinicola rhizosphaerae]GHB29944.1 magnesium transporter [Salinicola rhizosphaerae]
MSTVSLTILTHLGMAWLAGSLIGLERTFHGRPAGFRTHALVCVSSALLMIVTVYQWQWLGSDVPESTVRTDPTRMAQGIMTGIGFLGAGVIFKEGLTVRGLTTAASIWMTSALGILYGIGFLVPAVLATVLTLLTLSLFRIVEARVPTRTFARCILRCDSQKVLDEGTIVAMMREHRFHVESFSYRTRDDGRQFEYRMMLRTHHRKYLALLARDLLANRDLLEFQLSPTGD